MILKIDRNPKKMSTVEFMTRPIFKDNSNLTNSNPIIVGIEIIKLDNIKKLIIAIFLNRDSFKIFFLKA